MLGIGTSYFWYFLPPKKSYLDLGEHHFAVLQTASQIRLSVSVYDPKGEMDGRLHGWIELEHISLL